MCRLLVLAAALFASTAHAYQLKTDSTGQTVRWLKEAQFVVGADAAQRLADPNAFNAIQRAVDTVSQAAPGLSMRVVAGQNLPLGYDQTPGASNQNDVVVADDWAYADSAIAVTLVTVDVVKHQILDADIAFNGQSRRFRVLPETSSAGGEFDDIQNTLTHELGHAVGLAHNPDDPEVVMYPGARRGEVNKRQLSEDDASGLAALYGDGAAVPSSAQGEDVPQVGCSAGGGRAVLWTLLFALPALLLRRRRAFKAAAAAPLLLWGVAANAEPKAPELETASVVATAEVVSARTLPPKEGQRLLYTVLEVRVRECIKGDCGATLEVRVPGGRAGNIEQYVEDHPVPKPGEVLAVAVLPKAQRVFRLENPAEWVSFARALDQARLPAQLMPSVSPPTLRVPLTR